MLVGTLKNLKIAKRLGLCFGALGLTLLAVSALTWWGIAYLLKGRVPGSGVRAAER
jgi:hypothetical protein